MTYSIVFRHSGQPVTIPLQPDFRYQVIRAKQLRKAFGAEHMANVLFVDVCLEDGQVLRVDTKALLVKFYHTANKVRNKAFAEANAALLYSIMAKSRNPASSANARAYSEEVLWSAITRNLDDETDPKPERGRGVVAETAELLAGDVHSGMGWD
jgi:hypothetical protein